MQTSSPFSPRTGGRRRRRRRPSCRARGTGSRRATPAAVGLPSTKHETMSVPPEIDDSSTSCLIALVDVVEAFGHERRAGREHRAQRRRGRCVLARLERRLCAGVDVLGRGAEDASCVSASAKSNRMLPARMERRAVVEQQRRAGGEARDQPVPHHPAAGREVEQAVAGLDVACAAGAPSGAAAACRRRRARCTSARRSCPTNTGCRADGRTAAARRRCRLGS